MDEQGNPEPPQPGEPYLSSGRHGSSSQAQPPNPNPNPNPTPTTSQCTLSAVPRHVIRLNVESPQQPLAEPRNANPNANPAPTTSQHIAGSAVPRHAVQLNLEPTQQEEPNLSRRPRSSSQAQHQNQNPNRTHHGLPVQRESQLMATDDNELRESLEKRFTRWNANKDEYRYGVPPALLQKKLELLSVSNHNTVLQGLPAIMPTITTNPVLDVNTSRLVYDWGAFSRTPAFYTIPPTYSSTSTGSLPFTTGCYGQNLPWNLGPPLPSVSQMAGLGQAAAFSTSVTIPGITSTNSLSANTNRQMHLMDPRRNSPLYQGIIGQPTPPGISRSTWTTRPAQTQGQMHTRPAATGNTLSNPAFSEIHDQSLDLGLAATPENSLPPPIFPSALLATIPNWEVSCQNVVSALVPFIREPVNPESAEYKVLHELLPSHQFEVHKIERVVNNGLWRKFQSYRRGLLVSKSADFEILSGLGLTDAELQQQAHVFLNVDLPEGIPSYADNVALLFHGTRGNVDDVLRQGLDERLGRESGRLGRGIYFSDDPDKAALYSTHGMIFLCAVMLGDCAATPVSVDAVREPEKEREQQRNHEDNFFDSVVSRPTRRSNEFVIYNRNQCVPLYQIHYNKLAKTSPTPRTDGNREMYRLARKKLPPFAWTPLRMDNRILRPDEDNRWPFFAQSLIARMENFESESPPNAPVAKKMRTETEVMVPNEGSQTQSNLLTNRVSTRDYSTSIAGPSSRNMQGTGSTGGNSVCNNVGLRPTNIPAFPGFPIPILKLERIKIPESRKIAGNRACTVPYNSVGTLDLDLLIAASLLEEARASTSDRRSQDPNLTGTQNLNPPSIPMFTNTTLPTSTTSSAASNSNNNVDNSSASETPANAKAIISVRKADETWSLMQGSNGNTAPTVSTATTNVIHSLNVNSTANNGAHEECPICCCPMTPATATCTSLSCCAQNICKNCYSKLEITRQSMSKQTFTFLKCPYCGECSGTQIGTCPDGDMMTQYLPENLSGYEGSGTIQITYDVNNGRYTANRVAYLPQTPEGLRILELLRVAWDRRHVFAIGESLTRVMADVLVWNIHHKTQKSGGIYGYPDSTYLTRVADELKQYGIQ